MPAECSESLQESRARSHDLTAEPIGRVHKMAAVCKQKITTLVGLGISFRFERRVAGLPDRLKVVGHRVAVNRVPIPRIEGQELADFLANEFPRKGNAGVEPPVVADLKRELRAMNMSAQFLAFLDGHA